MESEQIGPHSSSFTGRGDNFRDERSPVHMGIDLNLQISVEFESSRLKMRSSFVGAHIVVFVWEDETGAEGDRSSSEDGVK